MSEIRNMPLTDIGREEFDRIFGEKAVCFSCNQSFKQYELTTTKENEMIVYRCDKCMKDYKRGLKE